jgi:hypothetical protein
MRAAPESASRLKTRASVSVQFFKVVSPKIQF